MTAVPGGDAPAAAPLRVRRHGSRGPVLIVLHGGPAAAGDAAPLARGLADTFRVLEPWQRGSGGEPLTVARHVADLQALVESLGPGARPAVAGHSWGAMLALAWAAAWPESAGPLALVACGTFDRGARARMREILEERMSEDLRRGLARIEREVADPGERMARRHELLRPLETADPLPSEPPDPEAPPFDARAHEETWADMVRLQDEGVYPAAFSGIRSPVLMLHGAFDPHPGRRIRAGLLPFLPRLEYREWERCGHEPWRERGVRDEFFAVLRGWLLQRAPR